MPSYKLTSLAEADLISIWLYIAEDNSDAADNVLDYLHLQCGVVSKNPQLGKLRKDLAENIFVYLAGKSGWRSKYLICYRVQDYGVEINRILEGHQDISKDWFS